MTPDREGMAVGAGSCLVTWYSHSGGPEGTASGTWLVQTHELMGRGDISLLNPCRIFFITEFYLEVFMYSSTSPLSAMFYNFFLPVCGLIFFVFISVFQCRGSNLCAISFYLFFSFVTHVSCAPRNIYLAPNSKDFLLFQNFSFLELSVPR